MKKWYSLPGLILGVSFLVVAIVFILKSREASEKFRTEKSKIAEILNFNDRLLSVRDWLFTEKAWEEKKGEFEKQVEISEGHLTDAKRYGHYLIYSCIAFFLLTSIIYFKRRKYFGFTLATTFVSFALLGQGVMNPIMEMSAFKEDLTIKFYVEADEIPYYNEAVEFLEGVSEYIGYTDGAIQLVKVIDPTEEWSDDLEDFVDGYKQIVIDGKDYLVEHQDDHVGIDKVFPGKTYFYYQNKGVIEVIHLLWTKDNIPVAIAVGAFSILVPMIKLLSSLIILISSITGAKRFRKFLGYISKWSMADVFVIAAFLSYLSFSNMSPGVSMDAKILFGLYYFIGYVVLSICIGYLLDASIREKEGMRS